MSTSSATPASPARSRNPHPLRTRKARPAAAIVNILAGKSPEMPRLNGACYNTVAPGYAFSLSGVYQPKEGQFAEVESSTSPVDAPREVRQQEAEKAENWFKTI